MKTTFSQLKLKDLIKGESSRNTAITIREQIISLLSSVDILELDLLDANFTPSIADEIIGGLAQILGPDSFKQRIKLVNVSESQMALMKHVVARRIEAKQNKL